MVGNIHDTWSETANQEVGAVALHLQIVGLGARERDLPVSIDEAREYFHRDVPGFLAKIEDVEQLRALPQSHCFFMRNRPVGGLNHYFTVVNAVRVMPESSGLTLEALDFDIDGLSADYPLLKGFVSGALRIKAVNDERTRVDFRLTMRVDFPLPRPLQLLPHVLVKTTADGVMSNRLDGVVRTLYQKVLNDFNLSDNEVMQ
jgi:hypothetical protein